MVEMSRLALRVVVRRYLQRVAFAVVVGWLVMVAGFGNRGWIQEPCPIGWVVVAVGNNVVVVAVVVVVGNRILQNNYWVIGLGVAERSMDSFRHHSIHIRRRLVAVVVAIADAVERRPQQPPRTRARMTVAVVGCCILDPVHIAVHVHSTWPAGAVRTEHRVVEDIVVEGDVDIGPVIYRREDHLAFAGGRDEQLRHP